MINDYSLRLQMFIITRVINVFGLSLLFFEVSLLLILSVCRWIRFSTQMFLYFVFRTRVPTLTLQTSSGSLF